MRRLIENSPVEKVFERSGNETDVYNAFVIAPTKTVRWYNWRLNEPFEVSRSSAGGARRPTADGPQSGRPEKRPKFERPPFERRLWIAQ